MLSLHFHGQRIQNHVNICKSVFKTVLYVYAVSFLGHHDKL